MSYPELQLRARLEYVLGETKSEASLYLATLGALFLAVDDENQDGEKMLESMFNAQAAAEGVDPDDLLQTLCNVRTGG